jgi:hypothetical protein
MADLRWYGDEVMAKVATAAALGIDDTMAHCVERAKADHPSWPPPSDPYTRFANRTAALVNSIRILDDARLDAELVSGQWGADMNYALYLEIGTSTEGPTAEARALAARGNMSLITPAIGPLMAPRPYLRPASDDEYPLLASRIAAAFRGAL